MSTDHDQYLAEIKEASILARELADQNPHLDFMDLMHTF